MNKLAKKEDPAAYKKLAQQGMMVAFPATVKGQTHRPDIGVGYHSTVKFFNPEKDDPKEVHSIASKLALNPPDPKQTKIEPGMFKDRFGNDVYVVKLHGPHADQIKDHNKKFSHLGHPETFEYQPHVSMDKDTWDKVVNSKAKTAHEAGIEFGQAELRHGHNKLATYGKKLAASENISEEQSIINDSDLAEKPKKGEYSRKEMLEEISRSNKEQSQKEEQPYGKYSLDPNVIRETIKLHPAISARHKKASLLQKDDLRHYMDDHAGLDKVIADKHLERLEHHFGQNKEHLHHAWKHGMKDTYRVRKEK